MVNIVDYTENKENIDENVLNKNNGEFCFDENSEVSDILVDGIIEETASSCVITDYISQHPRLDKYKRVIKNFLLKYIALPVDDGLATRTIERLEERQANGLLTFKNLHSKWAHIRDFFKFVGREDLVEVLEEWKVKTKKNKGDLCGEDDKFRARFNDLRMEFVKRPTLKRAQLLTIAIVLYALPYKLKHIMALSCDDLCLKGITINEKFIEIPLTSKVLSNLHTYILNLHSKVECCKLITLDLKGVTEKMRRQFGSCTMSKIAQLNTRHNTFYGLARVLNYDGIVDACVKPVKDD